MQAVYLLKTLQSFSQGSVAEALHSRNWVHLCHRTHGHVLKEWVPQSFQKGNPVPCKPAIIRRQTSERNDATKKDTWPHRKFRKRLNDFQQPVDTRQMHQSLPKFPKMLINKKNKKIVDQQKNISNFYWSTKAPMWKLTRMLINKKNCWSTKFRPQILLINKIVIFQYYLLPRGTAPPAVALAKFLGAILNPKP
jgi:hypothetical protein